MLRDVADEPIETQMILSELYAEILEVRGRVYTWVNSSACYCYWTSLFRLVDWCSPVIDSTNVRESGVCSEVRNIFNCGSCERINDADHWPRKPSNRNLISSVGPGIRSLRLRLQPWRLIQLLLPFHATSDATTSFVTAMRPPISTHSSAAFERGISMRRHRWRSSLPSHLSSLFWGWGVEHYFKPWFEKVLLCIKYFSVLKNQNRIWKTQSNTCGHFRSWKQSTLSTQLCTLL